jgi:hypothetical protein
MALRQRVMVIGDSMGSGRFGAEVRPCDVFYIIVTA